MSPVPDAPERQHVAESVRKALEPYQPGRYQISVNDDVILKDDNWYHVLVTTPNHERDREFYDALVKAEADLERAAGGKLHYLLVPVLG